ncbi:hypothetical protein E2C01_040521 [Portunus trituberculatus]|uniref:Uncharacterized protein n=1 Tax=Portunus trituberculatus TaxID=210409 RepID=A0A5B7FMW9_PORTR|nr:hypothetical protein [Portunus trituberculatus]
MSSKTQDHPTHNFQARADRLGKQSNLSPLALPFYVPKQRVIKRCSFSHRLIENNRSFGASLPLL